MPHPAPRFSRTALVTSALLATLTVGAPGASARTSPNLLTESAPTALRSMCLMVDHGVSAERLAALSRRVVAVGASAGRDTLTAVDRFASALNGRSTAVGRCARLGAKPTRNAELIRTAFVMRTGKRTLVVGVEAAPSRRRAGVRRLTVTGVPARSVRAAALDPLTGRALAVHFVSRSSRSATISLPVTAYPRLITFTRTATTKPVATTSTVKPTTPTTTPSPTTTPTVPTQPLWTVPFLASGPWRTPLSTSAPLDPHSPAIVSDLMSQISTHYGHVALNTSSYSAPIYTVPAGQPTVNLAFNNCQGKSSLPPGFAAELQNVPVPANAVPSIGTDSDMVIYQPSSDTEWEFWKMAKNTTTGVWSACWGGRMNHVSQNPGIFSSPDGTSASGLPMLGYLIRVSELQHGSINHAISIELPLPRGGAYSWPANRTDGVDNNPNDPAEGERFRLNPSLNINSLGLSPGALMIARAMQTYGLIVTDTAGVVAVEAEDPRPYEVNGAADPYTQYFPGGQYSWLQQIPWQDLQAVAWNYGKPS